MENEVIEFDIGLGGGGDDSVAIIDDEEMTDDSPTAAMVGTSSGSLFFDTSTYVPQRDLDLEPFEGMEFESEEAAKGFYNSYARRVGFSTRVSSSRRSRKDGAIIQRSFVCAKEGFRNLNEKRTKDREIKRPRTVTRVGCKASMSVKIQDSGKWIVSTFVKEHNHELVPPDQVHCLRSHRQISGPAKTLIDTLQAAGMGPRRIMSALIKEYGGISKVGFTEVDCRNYMRNNRQRSLEGDIQLLLDYLKQMQAENPSFFYAVQGGEEQSTALESRNEKEVKADYDTMNSLPLLRTPSPMEKHASELYTRKIFMRFQEELIGTLTLMASKVEDNGEVTTYQVSKYGEDNKSYSVNFNVLEMRATCSCCMFEFSGLLCRHVLAVFRVTNVLTLPSCYILKRWTINAKSSVILEERGNDAFSGYLESHTVRYNTLRHEAFKFVEEGAESVDTYNVAMVALEEAARKVAMSAKNEGTGFMVNGRSREDSRSNGTLTKMDIGNHCGHLDQNLSEDEMDRKIEELKQEVDSGRRKCEVYRSNLVSVLRDIEDHKQQLSLKRYSCSCFLG
ncbi:unnamed protein product [Lactuca virosa]|uniref:Protein FAR1-RELATED SEQUENCE n=1 Tax=Lactuca virosa TaxID=75947 RepID=A0AAU9N270_9ASTR|nr:unnamed protein product [Lactuca virosa]